MPMMFFGASRGFQSFFLLVLVFHSVLTTILAALIIKDRLNSPLSRYKSRSRSGEKRVKTSTFMRRKRSRKEEIEPLLTGCFWSFCP